MQAKKPSDAKSGPRVIKKYPNRRLYDTDTSTYITLSEVKQLVMNSEPFVVRDAKSAEDLTRSILLQIILEEEASGSPMFTAPVLSNIIRYYGHTMQGFMGGYLENNFQTLVDFQAKLEEQSKAWTPEMWAQFMGIQAPIVQELMGNNLEKSKHLFTQMQEQMLGTFGLKR
ncbi:MAG: hypothetical protein RL211_102 [Pseudomonadota bacterium]